MRNIYYHIFLVYCFVLLTNCKSGLVTTSNGCYDLIKSSQQQNRNGDYSDALTNFNQIINKCDAYDAKEAGYAGKADALNGLGRYSEALDAANAGLKINSTSIESLFEKANAEMGLGMNAEAKTDLQTINSLTEKNRNTAQRATIYAKIAAMDSKQSLYPDALNNINQAITLDPSNPDLLVLQGDIYSSSANYTSALNSYDAAIAGGKTDGSADKGKVETMIKMYQAKYSTSDAATLSSKMSSVERQNLCSAIQSGTSRGMKDMKIDMLQLSVCK